MSLRWIAAGPLSLQTSEFMKIFIVLYMAGYLVRRQLEIAHSVWGFVKPMILWLWIGGGIMALGTLLAAFPGSRRRVAVDPVSAPIAVDGPPSNDDAGVAAAPVDDTDVADDRTGAPV